VLNRTRVCVRFMQQFLKPAPKSAEEEAYLRNMLRDHPQFRLPEPKLAVALSYFRRQEVSEGETLIPQVGPWRRDWRGCRAGRVDGTARPGSCLVPAGHQCCADAVLVSALRSLLHVGCARNHVDVQSPLTALLFRPPCRGRRGSTSSWCRRAPLR
jgi:hypothetical protein